MIEFITKILALPQIQAALAAMLAGLFWNQIKNLVGYMAFRISPFAEDMVIFHVTPTGEAKATIYKAGLNQLTLKYTNGSETRFRYIFMSEFVKYSQDWQVSFDPKDSK